MKDVKRIPRKVWYGLESKSYLEIAQELPADDGLRKWIAIYATYQLNFENRRPGRNFYKFIEDSKNSNYVAIEFTIPIKTLETQDSIDSSDITIINLKPLEDEDEIGQFIQEKQINPELFNPPWGCDYPLD